MPTDEERRLLADNMRTFDVVGDTAGRYWLNGTLFGMDISARSEERIRSGMLHLAAFIEPAPKCSEAAPKCDRDALLALADTVHGMGVDCDAKENYAFGCTLRAIADRIREALGVCDG